MCTTHAQTSKGERNLERDYDAPTLAQLEEPPTRRCPICGGAAVLSEGDDVMVEIPRPVHVTPDETVWTPVRGWKISGRRNDCVYVTPPRGKRGDTAALTPQQARHLAGSLLAAADQTDPRHAIAARLRERAKHVTGDLCQEMPGREEIAARLAATIPWLGPDATRTVASLALLALRDAGLAVVPAEAARWASTTLRAVRLAAEHMAVSDRLDHTEKSKAHAQAGRYLLNLLDPGTPEAHCPERRRLVSQLIDQLEEAADRTTGHQVVRDISELAGPTGGVTAYDIEELCDAIQHDA